MYQECLHRSYDDKDDGRIRHMIRRITTKTMVAEFQKWTENITGYQLSDGGQMGWNALGRAAYNGNVQLVLYILGIGSPELLDLGNACGWTPLLCAVHSVVPSQSYPIAKELIRRGANVNTATFSYCGSIGEHTTPLWIAVHTSKNVQLIKLLIRRGAVIHPPLEDEQDRLLLQAANNEIIAERLYLVGVLKDTHSPLFHLPGDMKRYIFSFILA